MIGWNVYATQKSGARRTRSPKNSRGRDADNRERGAVEDRDTADRRPVGVQLLAPVTVADDRNRGRRPDVRRLVAAMGR
jgi:hypothetical protein